MKLEMYRGDTPSWNLDANQADGSPLDISTGSLFFTAKQSTRQDDVDAIFQKTIGDGITVSDGPGGLFTVKLATTDTDGLYAPQWLRWDCQYVNLGGDVFTVGAGWLLVKADVTISIS